MKNIRNILMEKQFFHWFIEFPEVFSTERGGFDCILTNPPWEALLLKEKEFFKGINQEIISASTQSERRRLIRRLEESDLNLFNSFKKAWIGSKKLSHYLTISGLFDLSAKGTINTYQLFVERCWNLINSNGYSGIICPTGIIMNYHLQDLFKTLVQRKSILSLFDFENRNQLFNIHRQFRFSLLTLGGQNIVQSIIPMTFYALKPKQIQEPLSLIFEDKKKLKDKIKKLPDKHILVALEQSDFELFNPNTITCPSFRFKKDADLLRHLYKQAPILIRRNEDGKVVSNPWQIQFLSMFHMSSDSGAFRTRAQLLELNASPQEEGIEGGIWIDDHGNRYYPLYEGKMIWIYDHRYAMPFSGDGMQHNSISVSSEQHQNPNFFTIPLYWISEESFQNKIPENYEKNWLIGFRDTTGATNERTFILSIFLRYPAGNTIPIMLSNLNTKTLCALVANITSIIFDYITRQKITGNHLNFYIVEQLPTFSPSKYDEKLLNLIYPKVLELTYTSFDLRDFANDLCYENDPFEWNPERRALLQAELDAIFALLYKINRKDLEYILETFLVFKESNDDQDNYKIVDFEKTKEQNLKVLQFIQEMIESNPDMNSSQVKDYLNRQRYFIKLYLKEVNKDFTDI